MSRLTKYTIGVFLCVGLAACGDSKTTNQTPTKTLTSTNNDGVTSEFTVKLASGKTLSCIRWTVDKGYNYGLAGISCDWANAK